MKSIILFVICILSGLTCFSQEYAYWSRAEFDEYSQVDLQLEKGHIFFNMDNNTLEIYNDSSILLKKMRFLIDTTTITENGFTALKYDDDEDNSYVQIFLDLEIRTLSFTYRDPVTYVAFRNVVFALSD